MSITRISGHIDCTRESSKIVSFQGDRKIVTHVRSLKIARHPRNKNSADLLSGNEHAVDLGDGHVSGNAGLVVDVTVTLALAGVVRGHLAREDVPE